MRSFLLGCVMAVCSVLPILLFKLWLDPLLGRGTPFLLFFAPMMLSAWFSGLSAGFVALALATCCSNYFFLYPYHSHSIGSLETLVRLTAFVAEGLAIVIITAQLRRTIRRALAQAEELRQSKEQLDIILRGVDDGITLQKPSGGLMYANDAAAQLLGYPSAGALIAASLEEVMRQFDVLDEAGAPLPLGELPGRKALQGARSERTVRFRVLSTGAERWAFVKGVPGCDADRNVNFAINIFQDIAERKLAEDALRVSREWLATVLRCIGDAVVATDRGGRVVFLNPIAERLTGWSEGEAAGRPLADVFVIVSEATRAGVESPVDKPGRQGASGGQGRRPGEPHGAAPPGRLGAGDR